MVWGAVIVAAGRGARFGRPKQFVELAGRPMVGWSIEILGALEEIVELCVVTEPEWRDAMSGLLERYAPRPAHRVVAGGATRQASVSNGLDALCARCEGVLVHDGARPLVRAEHVRAGMGAVRGGRGALLAAPVVDTIKLIDPATMTVQRTLGRDSLWAAQTPQFALVGDLRRAHAQARADEVEATDDVALLERIGIDVIVVPGSGENFKVTRPEDVERAEMLLRARVAS